MIALHRRGRAALTAGLAVVLIASIAAAHNFWVEPVSFQPQAGQRLEAALRIGHGNDVESYARNPGHALAFFLQAPDGTRSPLAGEPGRDPAGFLEKVPAGLSWIAYHSNFSSSELEPPKFESYLREEGLERIIEQRLALGEALRPGRERYARCAKALVRTAGAAGAHQAVLGLPVELVLGADPLFPPALPPIAEAGQGQPVLPVQLLAAGQAQVGALIVLERIDGPIEDRPAFSLRTDEQGQLSFPWPQAGRWLLSSVHMERATEAGDHEWRTHFASLAFEVPAPAVATDAK